MGSTKFIESRTGILREMVDATLGDRAAGDAGGGFLERVGLVVDPPLVRFRFLDSGLQRDVGWPVSASAVPLPLMADLAWSVPRVLVVENRDRTARHEGLTESERRALESVIEGPWLLEQERVPVDEANRVLTEALREGGALS